MLASGQSVSDCHVVSEAWAVEGEEEHFTGVAAYTHSSSIALRENATRSDIEV